MELSSSSSRQRGGLLALLVCASIWGLAFSAQKKGMEFLGPCGFNALRSFIGALALVPCIALLDYLDGRKPSLWGSARTPVGRIQLLVGGALCGLALGCASLCQQVGIVGATVGKAGFLTALYIIIVPIFAAFLGRRTSVVVWIAAGLALAGSALLCGVSLKGLRLQGSDLWLLACAVLFAIQILLVDRYVARTDCFRLSCLEFFCAGVVSLVVVPFAGESISFSAITKALWPLLFCGVLSSGVAYTLQCVGQKYVHPVVATLVMSLESVISALGGWLLLGENLKSREIVGCCIIFAAVLMAQFRKD